MEAFSKRITLPIKVTLHRSCSAAAFHDFIFSKIHAALDSLVYVKFDSESVEIVLPCMVQSYDIKLPVTNPLMINRCLPVVAVTHLGRDVKTIEIGMVQEPN